MITQATSISQNRSAGNRTAENPTAELALLIEGLTARLQAGEPLNLEEVVREHPEHAEELQELLPAMSLLVNLSRSAAGPAAPDFNGAPLVELGDFRIVREVGRGGMGVVYEAEQVSLGRRVALKVLPTAATLDPRQQERFKNEAKAVASLRHKHIVHVYGVGCEHGVHYYAMEFIEGQTLADVIRERRSQEPGARNQEPGALSHKSVHQSEDSVPSTQYLVPTKPIAAPCWQSDSQSKIQNSKSKIQESLSPSPPSPLSPSAYFRRAAELISDAASALEHAHSAGIIHRDIKPANLLLDSAGGLWVSDFGLARLSADSGLTISGDLLGTLRYMSPEQATGKHRLVNERTDVYSLGATLYELLTLRPPFTGADRQELLRQVTLEEPLPPRRLDGAIPAELETIVLKAMAKEPASRYPTAADFAADLARFLAGQPIHARPVGRIERTWRWCKRNPTIAGLTATVFAVAVLGLIGVLGQWQVAVASEQKAIANAATAQENAQEANTQRDEAQKQRDEVKAVNDQLQRTLYASHMNLAKNALDQHDVGRVASLLNQHQPKAGEPDLRGFEWHFLNRLSHADARLTLKLNSFLLSSVTFSPDGKRVITSTGSGGARGVRIDAELKCWDSETGQELYALERGVLFTHVVFSPDGSRFASAASEAGTVKIWELQTGKEVLALKGHTGNVSGVSYSPDGKRLASRSGAGVVGEIKIWDAATGQELRSLTGNFRGLAYSPDGKRLAYSTEGGLIDGKQVPRSVNVLDAETGQQLLHLPGGGGYLVYSSDGKRLASQNSIWDANKHAFVGAEVQVWDAQTGQEIQGLNEKSDGQIDFAFSPDGQRIALASQRSRMPRIKVCDTETGRELFTFHKHTDVINGLAFSPDSKRLASGSADQTLRIWDVESGQEIRTLSVESETNSRRDTTLAFSPDGKRLASGYWGGDAVRIWDLDQASNPQTFNIEGGAGTIRSDFKQLASATRNFLGTAPDKMVMIWDAESGRQTMSLKGHTNRIVSLAFSPDGKLLASGDRGSQPGDAFLPAIVRVWDVQASRELFTHKGHTSAVRGVVFSPDGSRLASVSAERSGEVKMWDVHTGQPLFTIDLREGGWVPRNVAFSYDGKRLATVRSSEVKIFNAENGQEILTLQGGGGGIAFSRDGKRLASGRKVWDTQTGLELVTLQAGTGLSLVFSPDGRRLASANDDGAVKLWDAQSGHQTLTFEHTGDRGVAFAAHLTHNLAFSADGNQLASVLWDGTVRIWDATPLPEKP